MESDRVRAALQPQNLCLIDKFEGKHRDMNLLRLKTFLNFLDGQSVVIPVSQKL